ncbi:hypothetical protein EZS27_009984 [termite gut metagenome]|uniref:Uncharacterized protein n=1 Tax=termite gut metagenome TaxID=433724 RepID=A0A5J4S813_9ZZZZ
MNNETQSDVKASISPQIIEALQNLQAAGYVDMLVDELEEILDFFIDEAETFVDNNKRLKHIQALRTTQKSLQPFGVKEGSAL